METRESSYSPLLISLPNNMSSKESYGELSSPLTTIVLMPISTPPVSMIPPLETTDQMNDKDELSQPLIRKRRSTRTMLTSTVSYRLGERKAIHNRLGIVSNFMCCLGLFGVILMIIENEITFRHIHDEKNIYNEKKNPNWVLKIMISVTTVNLVGLVFYYHRLDLNLYAINNSLDNWRVGLTAWKIILILLEALICAIHPFPQSFSSISNIKHDNSTATDTSAPSYIDFDVALGLPMFARIYLVCRFVMFHSPLVRDASSQSIGYLNEVSINFFFLIKTYLEQWPTRCLTTFCILLLFIGSWSLRACDYNATARHVSMLDSMWLFIVTFTTVGYGDLTPRNYCGRSVAAISGLVGVFSTALLISVLAQKLKLTRSEKYVHNFVLNIGLAKERKNQAVNIIICAVRAWYLKRKHLPTSIEYIKAQRRLFRSIHFNQQLKREQNKLIDNCIGLPELLTIQREVNAKTEDSQLQMSTMKSKVDQIEEKLTDMNQTMINIQNTLNVLLQRMP